MKNLAELYKKTKDLHHAYAIEGDKKTVVPELYSFFENDLKIQTKANPDFYFNEFESFGIDSGRELIERASRKAIQDKMRIFVVSISSITSEAQNALLKLFEEPAEGAYFFIIVQSSEIFIPTLRSRFNIIRQSIIFAENDTLINNFLKASKADRIKLLEDIIEEYKENKNKGKALDFLNNLEAILYKNKSKARPWTKQDIEIFEMIQKSRDYIRGRAPSVKMILENISLNV